MKLESSSFAEGKRIPEQVGFCVPEQAHLVCLGHNSPPELSRSETSEGAYSSCVIFHEPYVRSCGGDINQPRRNVPTNLPRVDLYHWALIDLTATVNAIQPGEFNQGMSPHGKPGPLEAQASISGRYSLNPALAPERPTAG